MTTQNTFAPFPQANLRVEATWSARPDGSRPESIVVEINDQPATGELVSQIIMMLFTAADINPELITAELVNSEAAMKGGTAR